MPQPWLGVQEGKISANLCVRQMMLLTPVNQTSTNQSLTSVSSCMWNGQRFLLVLCSMSSNFKKVTINFMCLIGSRRLPSPSLIGCFHVMLYLVIGWETNQQIGRKYGGKHSGLFKWKKSQYYDHWLNIPINMLKWCKQ